MAASRTQDERLLSLVASRAAGRTIMEVADRFGISTSAVSVQTNKVMDADMIHSTTETPADVARDYWPRK